MNSIETEIDLSFAKIEEIRKEIAKNYLIVKVNRFKISFCFSYCIIYEEILSGASKLFKFINVSKDKRFNQAPWLRTCSDNQYGCISLIDSENVINTVKYLQNIDSALN
jgi:hypothetical protein